MGQEIKVTGMVLQAGNIGEYDKRIVILTKERGRISAFARGAKKSTSTYSAACQPFTFGTFSLYEGKSSFNLMWAKVDDFFEGIKTDLDLIYYASYFAEVASFFTRENSDELNILKLLYQSLRALEKQTIALPLIRLIYEIKILSYYGLGMEAFHCVRCGSAENLGHFSPKEGGVVCDTCMQKEMAMDQGTLYTVQFIMHQPIEKLFTFRVSDEILRQLTRMVKAFYQEQVNHPFKSLEFLDE